MKNPTFYILIFLLLGIILGQYLYTFISIVLFFVCVVIVTSYLYYDTKYIYVFFLPIIFLLGILLIKINTHTYKKYINQQVVITGKVKDVKYTNNNATKLYVKDGFNYVLTILNYKDTNVSYGDVITYKSQMLPLDKPQPNNTNTYNEFLYEKSRGVHYKTFVNEYQILSHNKNIKYYMHQFSEKLKNNYDNIFNTTNSAIVTAMILGDNTIDEATKELFRVGGIYHILAISGLHISILVVSIYFVLTQIVKLNNKKASLITISSLFLYTILTGSSISTVRASLMCTIMLLAPLLNRKNNSLNSVYVSAIILLTYRPIYLFNVGFILSYSAVIGILIFTPILNKNNLLKEFSTASISAFIFTVVPIAYFFNKVYPYSIIVNMLTLAFTPILIIVSFLVGIVYFISQPIAMFMSHSVNVILYYFKFVCTFFAKLPFSTIEVNNVSVYFIVFYYLIIFIIIYYFKHKKTII